MRYKLSLGLVLLLTILLLLSPITFADNSSAMDYRGLLSFPGTLNSSEKFFQYQLNDTNTEFAEDRVIIKTNPDYIQPFSMNDTQVYGGLEIEENIRLDIPPQNAPPSLAAAMPEPEIRLLVLKNKGHHNVLAAVDLLNSLPNIGIAEPDYLIQMDHTLDDPLLDQLYGMEKIAAPAVWEMNIDCSEIIVAVIDTGIDYSHEDLTANIWKNLGEIAGNNTDDDANGFVDDIYGWNFVDNNNNVMDQNGHGTHVAGIIGAVGNNGIGLAGVAPNVKIMALKVLDNAGNGYVSDSIRAIEYAASMNVPISNNSYGSTIYSSIFYNAIQEANQLVVAAAGNNSTNNDAIPHFPSNYTLPNVLAVAATDEQDQLAWFSNYGANTVHLAAPGSDILSTEPGNRYGYKSGTSMAAPHVAGAAAVILAYEPSLTTEELASRIVNYAEWIPDGNTRLMSGNRLHVLNAVTGQILNPVTSMRIEQDDAALKKYESLRLTVACEPQNSTNKSVHWSSSDESIAKVSTRGVVSGVNEGTAIITATLTYDPAVYAQCLVTISGEAMPIDFTDTNFKDKVILALRQTAPDIYDNHNLHSALYPADVAILTELDARNWDIENLNGIEYFTGLTKLDCSANRIRELDVSKLTALVELNCASNLLSALDISMLPNLKILKCRANQLVSLAFNQDQAWQTFHCGENYLDISDSSQLLPVFLSMEEKIANDNFSYLPQTQAPPIILTPSIMLLTPGESEQFTTILNYQISEQLLEWSSADASIATVDENGMVTAHTRGKVMIRAAVRQQPDIYAEALVSVKTKVEDGDGSPGNPYRIRTAEDLQALSYYTDYRTEPNQTIREAYLNASYSLEPENGLYIDMAGINFVPIGYSFHGAYYGFRGSLEGNDKEIRNLTIRTATFDNNWAKMGMFSSIYGGTVQDLSLLNVDYAVECVNIHFYGVGALAGEIQSGAMISNIHCSGSIRGINEVLGVGGLTGSIYASTLSDCTAAVNITAWQSAGGMIGSVAQGALVRNCHASGTVKSSGFGGSGTFGGFAGVQEAESSIQNCSSSGDVVGSLTTGGFVGQGSGSMNNCFASGSVFGTEYIGGFVAIAGAFTRATISDCYATGTVSGEQYVGGFCGLTYHDLPTVIEHCYAIGAVDGQSDVGGFIGGYFWGSVRNSLATGNVQGTKNVGGFAGGNYNNRSFVNDYRFAEQVVEGQSNIYASTASLDQLVDEVFIHELIGSQFQSADTVAGKYPRLYERNTNILLPYQPEIYIAERLIPQPTTIQIEGSVDELDIPALNSAPQTAVFAATVYDQYGNLLETPPLQWSIIQAETGETIPGVEIAAGVVAVTSQAKDAIKDTVGSSFIITAALQDQPALVESVAIVVKRTSPITTEIKIYDDNTYLQELNYDVLEIPQDATPLSKPYFARVFDQYGEDMDESYQWQLTPADEHMQLIDNTVYLYLGIKPETQFELTVQCVNAEQIARTIAIVVTGKELPRGNITVEGDLHYGQLLSGLTLYAEMADLDGAPVAGEVSWLTPDHTPDAGLSSQTWCFTPENQDKYVIIKGLATITVEKATPIGTPVFQEVNQGGKQLADVPLAVEFKNPYSNNIITGNISWDEPLTTTILQGQAYNWTFRADESIANNYIAVTGSTVLWQKDSTKPSNNLGGGGGGGGSTGHTVRFESNGGSTVASQTVANNEKAKLPMEPTRSNYTFAGWFSDQALQQAYDFNTPVSENLTLYAAWQTTLEEPGTPLAGGLVLASRNSTGTDVLPYYLASSGQEVFAAFSMHKDGQLYYLASPLHTYQFKTNFVNFHDIEDHWGKEDILFNAARGIFVGTGGGNFSPNNQLTRGMVVTILGRIAGINSATYTSNQFTDVPVSEWYAPYVAWATENGIASATENGLFEPDTPISRGETALMLANFIKYMQFDLPVVDVTAFTDLAQCSNEQIKEAIGYLQTRSLIIGKSETHYDPQGTLTRAENAAMLHRLVVATLESLDGLAQTQTTTGALEEYGFL